MFIIYDFIFLILSVLYIPNLVIRGKWHKGFKARFGFFSSQMRDRLKDRPSVWIHAVSVGEVLAVADIMNRLQANYPEYTFVCSTVTPTGHKLAQEKLDSRCVVIYAPLDFSWIVRKFIRTINPKIYVSTETEIWPNLYTALRIHKIALLQINGRISDKAFKGYKKIRFMLKPILSCVHYFYMQSEQDARRIQYLGAPHDRVSVVGNVKFDNIPAKATLRKEELGYSADNVLLIAGSTHPGEEKILLNVYEQLLRTFSYLRLIIAPRHIERLNDIFRLINQKNYTGIRYSDMGQKPIHAQEIVVVDTIGDLAKLYHLSDIVYIGKTLTVGGGQNVIEPASLGKPTIVGPLTQNFKDAVDLLKRANALIQIQDQGELLGALGNLLADPDRARALGEAAQITIQRYQGASQKIFDAISKEL